MLGLQLEISSIEYRQTQLPKRMITYIRIWLLWILQATKKLNGLGLVMKLPYMGIMYCQVCFVDNQLLTVIILVVVMPRPTPSFCCQVCSILIPGLPSPSFPLLHPIT